MKYPCDPAEVKFDTPTQWVEKLKDGWRRPVEVSQRDVSCSGAAKDAPGYWLRPLAQVCVGTARLVLEVHTVPVSCDRWWCVCVCVFKSRDLKRQLEQLLAS